MKDTDTKWADVAHYYLKSKIAGLVKTNSGNSIESLLGIYDVDDTPRREFTPILRALEDMTEAEAREWFKMEEGKEWPEEGYMEHKTALERWKFFMEVMWCSDGKWHPVYSPAEFHWLISKGFDVFGLIESGQAIRKGMENG